MSAYEMGTKSQYQRFQAWFQITLPQTSPLDQLPRPGVQACVCSGTPATSPMPRTAQTTRCLAKKNAIGRRERAREHAKPATEEPRLIYLDFS